MTVFLQTLAVASVGLIAPASILLVILMLVSGRGWWNGVAFVFGYLVMYTAMGAGILILGDAWVENITADQISIGSMFLIGLGMLFLGISLFNLLKRPDPDDQEAQSPFARIVDGISPLGAFCVGAAVTVLNLKNLTIFLSAVSVLLLSDLVLLTQLMMLVVMVVFFCSTTMMPVGICILFPDRSSDYLGRMKVWLGRYSRLIGVSITLLMGCYFFYLGIWGIG